MRSMWKWFAILFISLIVGGSLIGFVFFKNWCQQYGTRWHMCQKWVTLSMPSTPISSVVTNSWYSSLFFSDWGEMLVYLPGMVKVTPAAVQLMAGQPNFSPKAVMSSSAPLLLIQPKSTQFSSQKVTQAGEWHVGITLKSQHGSSFLYLQKGSPTVWVQTAGEALEVVAAPNHTLELSQLSENAWLLQPNGGPWYFVQTQQGQLTRPNSQPVLDLPASGSISVTQLPDTFLTKSVPTTAALKDIMACPVTRPLGTELVVGEANGDSLSYRLNVLTPIRWSGQPEPTLMTVWPHHQLVRPLSIIGEYLTARGTLQLVCADHLELKLPNLNPPLEYLTADQAAALSPEKRQKLQTLLRADWQHLQPQPIPAGVYFRGKQLKFVVDLWLLAQKLDQPLADEIWSSLQPLLLEDVAHFRVDPDTQAVFYDHVEFGHEFGNDHHFQFGYWLHIYTRTLSALPAASQPKVQRLIDAFIAEGVPKATMTAPLRTFRFLDTYEGHSWADGRALFADGNNQESSSEALQYWYSIWWWGQQTKNERLTQLAQFAMVSEMTSRDAYWLMVNNPGLRTRSTAPMYSLIWGDKADYATWFSPDDDKIVGIQFLPLFPGSNRLYQISDEAARQKILSTYFPRYSGNGPQSSASFAHYLQAMARVNGSLVEYSAPSEREYVPQTLLELISE